MKPKTVVVVEDEPKYATPLCRFLKRKGFQVVHARTGSGLRHLLATRADLRLVLLDLQLSTRSRPGDGIENILYIRRLYPIIPIIVLTNHVDPINVVPAIRAGATDLIQKSPEYTTEFLELIVEPKLRRQLSLKIGEDFHHIRGKLTGLSENAGQGDRRPRKSQSLRKPNGAPQPGTYCTFSPFVGSGQMPSYARPVLFDYFRRINHGGKPHSAKPNPGRPKNHRYRWQQIDRIVDAVRYVSHRGGGFSMP